MRLLNLSNHQLIGFDPGCTRQPVQLESTGSLGQPVERIDSDRTGQPDQPAVNLWLHNNQLSGSIPSELDNLTSLTELYLYNNRLSGIVPSELGNLSNLVRLRLYNNQLSGSIPSELGNLTSLTELYLYNNRLSGIVPSELGNLSNLARLYLQNNQLSGPLPSSFVNLTNLKSINLWNTRLCAPTDAVFQVWLNGIEGKIGVVNCAIGRPDLVFSEVSPASATVARGESADVTFTIRNAGDADSPATLSRAYQSSDATIATSDDVVTSDLSVPSLAPSATHRFRFTITTDSDDAPGTYFFGMCVDPVSGESDTGNNCSTAFELTIASPGPRNLTNNSASDSDPAWSADYLIAFTSGRNGDFGEIYVMEDDGSNVVRLTNHSAWDDHPTWSPSGGRIAFSSGAEIYTMDADGSNVVQLTNHSATDWFPAWSPDGDRIAFTSWRDGNGEIYVMDADGSTVVRLTNHSAEYEYREPAWSPDGGRIAFQSYDPGNDGNDEIFVMDADGSNIVQLTNHSANDWMPAWSPDGGRIAFVSDRGGNYDIYIMGVDGSNVVQLTNHSAVDWEPDWSPDGDRIAFSSYRNGNQEIYVMDVPAPGAAATARAQRLVGRLELVPDLKP